MLRVVLVLYFSLFLFATNARAQDDGNPYIKYDDFISKVRAGEIKAVQLDSHAGHIKASRNPSDGSKCCDIVSFRTFRAGDDPLLLSLLREKNVDISFFDTENDYSGSYFTLACMGGIFLFQLTLLVLLLRINSRLRNLSRPQET